MSNVMEEFLHLDTLSLPELHSRYQLLKGEGPSRELSDEVLKELLAIARVLRKRASAPSAAKKAASGKIAPSLDAL